MADLQNTGTSLRQKLSSTLSSFRARIYPVNTHGKYDLEKTDSFPQPQMVYKVNVPSN